MSKWAAMAVGLAAACACLGGAGVSGSALARLVLALGLMLGAALLIAWPFLRKPTR